MAARVCDACDFADSRRIDDLTRLRSRNHSREVGIFAAFEGTVPALGHALSATLFLGLLFLSADPFSLAFFHAVNLSIRSK